MNKRFLLFICLCFLSGSLYAKVRIGTNAENCYPIGSSSELYISNYSNGVTAEFQIPKGSFDYFGVVVKLQNGINFTLRDNLFDFYAFTAMVGPFFRLPIANKFFFKGEIAYGMIDMCGKVVDSYRNTIVFNSINQIVQIIPSIRYEYKQWTFDFGIVYTFIPQVSTPINELGYRLTLLYTL